VATRQQTTHERVRIHDDAKECHETIKDSDVKYVDFRLPIRAAVAARHFDVSQIEEDTFAEGMMFDGSSIAAEGDQRIRSAYADRSACHRSVLRRTTRAGLRRARADHRRVL